jgi:signal transduction histidine kinase
MTRIIHADRAYGTAVAERIESLDTLRAEFLIDLSHQLRTPVTAMKMAMDGLLEQLYETMDPSQRDLANISRRNLDRVVLLVENQLDLLQMMSGERPVRRRLVDINALLLSMTGESVTTANNACSDPLRVFTVPEVLKAVIGGILGSAPPNAERFVSVECCEATKRCCIEVRVDYTTRTEDLADDDLPDSDNGSSACSLDFERRAYETVLGFAGGSLEMEKDENRKRIRIHLPWDPRARDVEQTAEEPGPVRR